MAGMVIFMVNDFLRTQEAAETYLCQQNVLSETAGFSRPWMQWHVHYDVSVLLNPTTALPVAMSST